MLCYDNFTPSLNSNSQCIFYSFLKRDELYPIAFDNFSKTNELKYLLGKEKDHLSVFAIFFLKQKYPCINDGVKLAIHT